MREVMNASPSEYHIEGSGAVAEAMGVSSVVVQELRSRKGHSDLSLLALEGETGPNLLCCYARLCAEIASTEMNLMPQEIPNIDYSPL